MEYWNESLHFAFIYWEVRAGPDCCMATNAECKGFLHCLFVFYLWYLWSRYRQNLVADRLDNFLLFQPLRKKYRPREMMWSTFIWQVQLCKFVTVFLLTQSWARSKCLVLSLINKLFFFFPGKLSYSLFLFPNECRKNTQWVTWIRWLILSWSWSWSCWEMCGHTCSDSPESPLKFYVSRAWNIFFHFNEGVGSVAPHPEISCWECLLW